MSCAGTGRRLVGNVTGKGASAGITCLYVGFHKFSSHRLSAFAIDMNACIMLKTGMVSKPPSAARGKWRPGDGELFRKVVSSGVDGKGVGNIGKSILGCQLSEVLVTSVTYH